ncbi:Chibby family like protein [Aduncisulcus paluster]|uniref:Chibby family like protein n=1 Tax=Aduncisulcus paluster TaxID=2918883 RepID=A0ABQ5K655_9EUKA|nr:Chibby family like protein [Aduncisulcus paluster]
MSGYDQPIVMTLGKTTLMYVGGEWQRKDKDSVEIYKERTEKAEQENRRLKQELIRLQFQIEVLLDIAATSRLSFEDLKKATK